MYRFLIVDDNPENVYLLKKLLLASGHEVDTASNGIDALNMARNNPPDIIISDIFMPDMDGFRLCRKWKSDARLKSIPFIFYTATYTEPKDEEFALQLGADRFIRKPMDPNQFMELILEIIDEVTSKKTESIPTSPPNDLTYLEGYSDTLIRKLESKMGTLEQTRDQLKKKQDQLLEAQRIAKLGNWEFDREINRLEWSGEMFRIFEMDPETCIPSFEHMASTVLEEDRQLFQDAFENTICKGIPHDIHFRIKTSNGQIKHLHAKSVHQAGQFQKNKHPIGIIQDITDQKKTEQALRASQKELRIRNRIANLYLSESDTAIYPKLMDVLLDATASQSGLIGQLNENNQIICLSLKVNHMNQDAAPLSENQWSQFLDHSLKNMVAVYDNDNPALPPILPSTARGLNVPIIYQDKLLGTILVADRAIDYDDEDLYQMKTIAKYIAPIFHSSLQRDIQRNKSLKLAAQLQQSQRLEAIGTLAGGVAHDFNNILFPIVGYTELVLDELPESGNAKKYLREVLAAAKRAGDLVRQILAFSRQNEQEKKPLKVQIILKEAMKLLRATIPTTIEIHQQIQADAGFIHGNATQIHQVIVNLCTNAFQAMRQNGGVLEISLSEVELTPEDVAHIPEASPGPYIRLSIADTGHGMDNMILQRIFEPYFTTKKRDHGTGLGLSVVHGIVKNHGGYITVYSEPGKGSVFHVFFPRIQSNLDETSGMVSCVEVPKGVEHILLVDDEFSILKMIQHMLTKLGYQVTTSSSSPEVLELFQSNPYRFDLVITDMTMPRMTGLQLSEHLLRIRNDIPIILMTGFSEHITGNELENTGIKAFLMKPITRKDLAETIRNVLNQETICVSDNQ